MPTMRAVQDELMSTLETNLSAIKSGLTTDKRVRKDLITADSNYDRGEIMGKNLYYLTVLPAPSETSAVGGPETDEGGGAYQRRHGFRVRLNLQYEDASTYSGSSQKTFDDLTHNDANSLMETLVTTSPLTVGSEPVFIEEVREEELGFESMQGLEVLAHVHEVFVRTVYAD